MTLELALNHDTTSWDAWLNANAGVFGFLQSFAWSEVVANRGVKVERWEIRQNKQVISQALVEIRLLGPGLSYGIIPKGPVIMSSCLALAPEIYLALRNHFAKLHCVFLRVEPTNIPLSAKPVISVSDQNPRATLVLDLEPSEEQLLMRMHSKMRYNINLSEKKGVTVMTKKSSDIFWNLIQGTGTRDNFRPHGKAAYEAVLASSASEQLIAYVGDTPVASAIFFRFGKTYTYLYGASNHEFREYMAPPLMQFTAITRAKAQGFSKYEFFGIAPSNSLDTTILHTADTHTYDSNHRYAGVTRFKLGFGGIVYEEPGTFDLVISPLKYKIYQAARKLRRLI